MLGSRVTHHAHLSGSTTGLCPCPGSPGPAFPGESELESASEICFLLLAFVLRIPCLPSVLLNLSCFTPNSFLL